ncbi:MAG: hypothetical protein Q7T96_16345 [Methylobacter sp.]|nr:hypothetical protein [Methylobacter sp.]
MFVIRQFPRFKTYCQLRHCHPWHLDPGNPCRDDVVTQTLVYNDERAAWKRDKQADKQTFQVLKTWKV